MEETPALNPNETDTRRPFCTAISHTTGKPCHVLAMNGSPFCYYHDPSTRDKLKAAAAKGGENSKPLRLGMHKLHVKNASDVHELLGEILTQIGQGKVQLNTVALRVIPSMAKTFLEAESQVKLEKRLAELESQVTKK